MDRPRPRRVLPGARRRLRPARRALLPRPGPRPRAPWRRPARRPGPGRRLRPRRRSPPSWPSDSAPPTSRPSTRRRRSSRPAPRGCPASTSGSRPRTTCPSPTATSTSCLRQLVVNFLPDAPAGRRGDAPGRPRRGGSDRRGGLGLRRRDDPAADLLGRCRRRRPRRAPSADEGRAMVYITPDPLRGALDGRRARATSARAPTVVGADYDDFADLWAPFEAGVGTGRGAPAQPSRPTAGGAARGDAPPARRGRRAVPAHGPRLAGRRLGALTDSREPRVSAALDPRVRVRGSAATWLNCTSSPAPWTPARAPSPCRPTTTTRSAAASGGSSPPTTAPARRPSPAGSG